MSSAVFRTACALLVISAVCLIVPDAISPPVRADASAPRARPETWWAFVPPARHDPPQVRNNSWVRNPIDNFVLARLKEQGLSPAPEASKQTLIRRAYLDLIGLLPSPQEVDAFVSDPAPDAFDRVVDRLLASPQYGERWARHWLDLARYAESEGFKADETRPYAWRYRDWVINAFNNDEPYNEFVREQIAGDELYPNDPQAHVATYFLRSYPDESNARNLYQRRQELLNDDTDTMGAVFLGMTFGCARCHDHKYDPIPQRDYYRLQAFLADIRADDHIVVASADQVREHDAKLAAWEEKTNTIRDEMARIEEPKRRSILDGYFKKFPAEIQASLLKPEADRTPLDWVLHYKAAQYMEPWSYQYLAPEATCAAALNGEAKKRWTELKNELAAHDDLKPADLPLGTGIADAGAEAPKTYVLRKGVYDAFKEEVQPGFPSCVELQDPQIKPCPDIRSTGRRTALANWLARPTNPLTARVMVNRIWQYHFGRGIAEMPSDLGKQGGLPTHPELLDWLTLRFVHDGWSMKKLHRLIMTSSAYRQAAQPDAVAMKVDPDDKLLWRFPRQRLDAEVIRDSALAVSGLLNSKMGGPSVFPEIPKGMEVRGGWPVTKSEAERNRRSVYVFVRRNTRYPMFEAFDMPDPYETCPRRYVTTTPSQALMLLNGNLSLQWAQHFAGRVLSEAGSEPQELIDAACRLAWCRHASPAELDMMSAFLSRQEGILAKRLASGQKVALPLPPNGKREDASVDPVSGGALVDLCHVLLNSNEFVYSD